MLALLAGIPIAGNVLVALSTTLTVYLSELAKRDPTPLPARAAVDGRLAADPLAFIW